MGNGASTPYRRDCLCFHFGKGEEPCGNGGSARDLPGRLFQSSEEKIHRHADLGTGIRIDSAAIRSKEAYMV